MLRLSKLTDYGAVMMSYMAQQPKEVYSVVEIATAVGVAPPTVSKILKTLARYDLVQARRGSQGGYYLSRPPGEISIVEVIEAIEGPLGITECSVGSGTCTCEAHCRVQTHWQRINGFIRRSLEQVTLADMSGTGTSSVLPIR